MACDPQVDKLTSQVGPDAESEAVEIALLDRDGVIVAVNEAWEAFSAANGGDPDRTGVGMSYLEICDGVGPDPFGQEVGAAIRMALSGDMPAPLAIQVPCHSPDISRWFDALISSRHDDDGRCLGATVTLSKARSDRPVGPVRRTVGQPEQVPLRLLEDQQMLFSKLHDQVIAEIFAVGMNLQRIAAELDQSAHEVRIDQVIESLDSVIRRIRNTVFDSFHAADRHGGLSPSARLEWDTPA